MRKIWVSVLILSIILSACRPAAKAPTLTPPPMPPTLAPAQVNNPLFLGTETTPSRIIHQGGWMLLIYYRAKGTRSEGQHGVLLFGSQVFTEGTPGMTIETDLGTMKYYMHPQDMKVLWDTTGWNYANTGLIKPWEGPAK